MTTDAPNNPPKPVLRSSTKLSVRQQRFVEEYLVDFNGKQAAIRAGYAPHTADITGAQLLALPKVKARVDWAIANRVNRIQVRQDEVVRELLRLAMVDTSKAFDADGKLLPIQEWPEDVRRAIASFDVEERSSKEGTVQTLRKVRFWSKPQALELLSRHLGMLRDKSEDKPAAVFNLVINGIRTMQKELATVDAKALPAQTIEEGVTK
jgi:phage terminase small subunit